MQYTASVTQDIESVKKKKICTLLVSRGARIDQPCDARGAICMQYSVIGLYMG